MRIESAVAGRLRIDTSHGDAEATVTVRTGDHETSFNLLGRSRYAYMKLTVSVPPQLAVAIDSASGDVVAQSLESLDFHSGSGDFRSVQPAAGVWAITASRGPCAYLVKATDGAGRKHTARGTRRGK